jgi:hypothetical protein
MSRSTSAGSPAVGACAIPVTNRGCGQPAAGVSREPGTDCRTGPGAVPVSSGAVPLTGPGVVPANPGAGPLRRPYHALGDLRQIQRAAVIKAALPFGQRQQRFRRRPCCSLRSSSRRMIDRMDEVSESRCRRLSSSNARSRVSGVRSSRGRVGDEALLRVLCTVQTFQQPIDRVGEIPQLVAGSAEGESLVDVAGGDPLDGRVHRPQRAQDPPSHPPAEHE